MVLWHCNNGCTDRVQGIEEPCNPKDDIDWYQWKHEEQKLDYYTVPPVFSATLNFLVLSTTVEILPADTGCDRNL